MQIKRLQSLVWWAQDHQRRGLPLVAADYDAAAMTEAMASKGVKKERGGRTDASIKDLLKLDPDDFDIHEDAFLNLLAQTSGALKELIRYIACERVVPAAFADGQEERMYQMALARPFFEEDYQVVFRLLKSYLIGTAG